MIALGKKAVLAVDYGASSGRLVLGILKEDTKKIELKEMHRFKNCSVKLNQYEYWDFPYLYNELKEGLKKVFSKESIVTSENIEVLGLGVDTWGVDYGWIDERGELLSLPICYRDTRTEEFSFILLIPFIKYFMIYIKEKFLKKEQNSFNLCQIYLHIFLQEKNRGNIQSVPLAEW